MSNMAIGRGWIVYSKDNKRVGDVTEVHPHYLLVSKGVILIKDMYLPIGAVARTDGTRVILSINYDVLRKMDLSHEPAPIVAPEPEPYHDPSPGVYDNVEYPSEADMPSEPLAFPGTWGADVPEYEETPSYSRPLPNGLIEVEHALNLAFQDLGYGMPVVFLQGWPFDSTIWEPLPAIIAAQHRVILFDTRGSGDSDRPWDYYSLDTLVHDLHRVIIEQSLHDVTLIAWSSAASVALQYAREHPARLARVLLLSPLILQWLAAEDAESWVGHRPDLDLAAQDAWTEDLLNDRSALFERLVDRLTNAPLSSARRQWLMARLLHGAPHAQGKLFEVMRAYDPTGLLVDIKAPVTILSGEQDRLSTPALAARLAEQLPGSQVITIGNCGHACFIDCREVVVKAILDVVDSPITLPEDAEDAVGAASTDPGDHASESGTDPDLEEDPELDAEPNSDLIGSAADRSLLLDE
jgi:non-heme chloroperoxidase